MSTQTTNSVEPFDAIVIGTGQGGKPLALALAGAGRKTAVVERSHVGASCVNYGCTPTKTMVASARLAWLARRAAHFDVESGDVSLDMKKVRQRKRSIVESFRSSSEKSLEKTKNLTLIRGEGSFEGVDGTIFAANRCAARSPRMRGSARVRAPFNSINVKEPLMKSLLSTRLLMCKQQQGDAVFPY